jgi:archaellum component FlaC
MSPETWKKVKSVFNEASELPTSERTPFLVQYDDEIRREVEKMLNAVEDENLLLNEPIVDFREFADDSIPEKIGD